MRRIVSLIWILLTCCNLLKAQADTIPVLIEKLEANRNSREVIDVIERLLKNSNYSNTDKLKLQNTLVHKYQELQQWDVCLNFCQQQVELAHQQKNTLAEASFYKMIGNTYYHIPDKEKAVLYWNKCIAISEPNGFNVLLEQCYHNIGSIYIEQERHFDLAEKYLLQSVNLSIANKTSETALGRLHSRLLATLYEKSNRLEKASAAYSDLIAKCRAVKDSANLAEALMFYCDVLLKQNKISEALELSSEALEISKKVARLDMVRTALGVRAECLYAAGKYKDAYKVQTEAVGIISTRFNSDLNSKLSEAEAKFKTAEAEHGKALALIEAKKEKQIYIISLIGLFAIASLWFYYFHQKKQAQQKTQMQNQLQEEKERLSRDLHDNLGSQMALLSNNIEALDINFKKQQDVGNNIGKVKSTSKQLLQTLRETIWILNKEQVTAQEFMDKLIDYAHRYLQSYPGIKLEVKDDFAGSKILNSNEALQLFRICQEAITNACKYAQTEKLMIESVSSQKDFTIIISDFGKGFENSDESEDGHYGLINMKKRAKTIHAVLKIDSGSGQGVTVSITLA